jgi:hypothetical protein
MEAPNIMSASQHEFDGMVAAVAAIEPAIYLGQAPPAFGSVGMYGLRPALKRVPILTLALRKDRVSVKY